jgi:hypothetical protein
MSKRGRLVVQLNESSNILKFDTTLSVVNDLHKLQTFIRNTLIEIQWDFAGPKSPDLELKYERTSDAILNLISDLQKIGWSGKSDSVPKGVKQDEQKS